MEIIGARFRTKNGKIDRSMDADRASVADHGRKSKRNDVPGVPDCLNMYKSRRVIVRAGCTRSKPAGKLSGNDEPSPAGSRLAIAAGTDEISRIPSEEQLETIPKVGRN